MDYETIINSAYLRQGHADEFTRQDPAKRKEVLGNILGLSFYDEIEDRAKEIAKRHEADTAQLENAIGEINGELAQRPAGEAELEEAQRTLAGIETTVQEQEAVRKRPAAEERGAGTQKAATGGNRRASPERDRDLQRWEEQAGQYLARIKEHEAIIGRKNDIEAVTPAIRRRKRPATISTDASGRWPPSKSRRPSWRPASRRPGTS
jgi:exonuclease SbcC